MKYSSGIIENGIITGNIYNKYDDRNPLVKLIMRGFEKSLTGFIDQVKPIEVHEVGCGEGYWIINFYKQGINAKGTDISENAINIARDNAGKSGIKELIFQKKSIYNLTAEADSAELVVCCEVLEHLDEPEAGIANLSRIANPYLIVSVPREPIWRILNMARGKYLSTYGNTPGHVQHWTKKSFIALVSRYFEILEVRTPLPWTMVLSRRKVN